MTLTPSPAPSGPAYVYRAQAVQVIDGDTFLCRVDLGFNVHLDIHVRLYGVNAPEHTKPGGPEATAYLTTLLAGKPLLLASHHDDMSFARWVCQVWLAPNPKAGPVDVAAAVISNGHGVAFDPARDRWQP